MTTARQSSTGFDASTMDAAASRHMLEAIVTIQREHVRNGDRGALWDLVLDAMLDLTGSARGFVAELDWSATVPDLETRAVRWTGEHADPSSEVGVLISHVVATETPLVVDPATRARRPAGDAFLALPLMSSDRLVGVVCLAAPRRTYPRDVVARLEPLVLACAGIVEALQSARERTRAAQRLAETASFLSAVIESTVDGVVVIRSSDSVIESVNGAAAELAGLPATRLIGAPVADLLDDRTAAYVARFSRVSHRRGLGSLTPTFRATVDVGGRTRTLDLALSEFSIDGVRRVVTLVRDVSEQVAASRLAERAGAILDQAPDLVAWSDEEGALRYLNRGGRRLLGWHDERPGTATVDGFVPAWQRVRLHDEVIPAARRDGTWSGELTFAGPDGEIPVWLVALSGRDDDEGYLAFLARDLRERDEIERIKASFVSSVSHELRTPLTSIIGYVELLQDGAFGEIAPGSAGILDVIHKNGRRLLELIGDILHLSAFDAGMTVASEEVDVETVIDDVLEQTAVLMGARTVERRPSAGHPTVRGSRTEIETLVTNLVTNAARFSSTDATVGVGVETAGDEVVLTVSDTGMGMPENEIPRLFERFQRGEAAHRDEIQGTGLGLAIVDAVVRRHGGRIDVTSTVGVGTTFAVRLPRHQEAT